MPYKIHSMSIFPDALGSAVVLPDLEEMSLDMNVEVNQEMVADSAFPAFANFMKQAPQHQGGTLAIPTLLDAIGIAGICIKTATNPGILTYLQKIDDCGKQASGSVHRTFTTLSGVIVPNQLTVEHGGNAKLTFTVHVAKKSANDVIVLADNAALPSVSVTGNRWTLAGVTIGGIALTDYTNLSIDFNNTVETRGVQSDLNDAFIEVNTTAPTITLSGIDPAWLAAAAIPVNGLACTHANTKIYLRKRTAVGFVANGTAEHLSFTADGLAYTTQAFTGQQNRFTETSLTITTQLDSSSNNPIIYNGATAIT